MKNRDNEIEKSGASYWYAVLLNERGKRKEAATIFKNIIKNYPFNYYAIMSIIRLKEIGESISIQPLLDDKSVPENHDRCKSLPEKIKLLIAAGLEKEAKEEIKAQIGNIVEMEKTNPENLISLTDCSISRDFIFQEIRKVFNSYLTFFPYKDILIFWKILHPKIRINEVKNLSSTYGVPENLILSIMRQESAFDPYATSQAGAMGLMQIMPATARQLASQLGENYNRKSIYNPETNMKYGVYYFSKLVEKFNSNHLLAIAAYNAGPNNVERWLKRKWTTKPDLFVEFIPLSQTRNYVRNVLTSFARYSYLYDGTIEPVLEIASKNLPSSIKKEPSF
ncbi:MAG: lytic transglycosylase domain-containing protein [Candidatus Omnitrophica bacterium]|nr:lytic transglycosylase domain-containing protein [Candidatus Omnitrophota bacterium]